MEDRKNYIDVVKGFSIILICLGHVMIVFGEKNSLLYNYFYSFHVPIFFIITGLLYATKKVEYDLKKILFKNLYPYLTFSFIYIFYSLCSLLWNAYSLEKLRVDFLNIIIGVGVGPLWFLPVYTFALCIFLKMISTKKRKRNILLFIIIVMLLLTIEKSKININYDLTNIDIVFNIIGVIKNTLLAVFFMMVGYIFKRKIDCFKYTTIIICLGIINLCLFNYYENIDIHLCQYGNLFVFLYFAISNSFFWICFFEKICLKKDYKFLSFCGKNSLIILGTHITLPILRVSQKLIILFEKELKFVEIKIILALVILMIIEYIMIYCINKWFIKIIKI